MRPKGLLLRRSLGRELIALGGLLSCSLLASSFRQARPRYEIGIRAKPETFYLHHLDSPAAGCPTTRINLSEHACRTVSQSGFQVDRAGFLSYRGGGSTRRASASHNHMALLVFR